MNLKLRRLVRTPASEQYALFDLDKMDENYDPVSAGKIDLHIVPEDAVLDHRPATGFAAG